VNLGLNENSKLNDSNKNYEKRLQTSKSSGGQRGSLDQLKGSKKHLRCIICNCAFVKRESILKHMHKKHAGLFIICRHNRQCAEIFRTEAEKTEHILQLTNKKDRLIKCDFCSVMHIKSILSKHLKINHKNENLIRCSYQNCTIRFRSEVEKQNHEALVHVSTKKDKCIFCNLFFSEDGLLHHYQRKHKNLLANAFKCKFKCRGYFLTKAEREEHIASAHKRPMRAEVTCLYCNKICIDKDSLKYHINTYHSAVKILCKVFNCHQYFHTKTEADEHFEQQHQKMEEKKKYRCLKCNYRSAHRNNFEHHISGMHGEKILPCPKCSKSFSSFLTLKIHISKVHSTPKVCPHCNKSYSNIRMHLKQEKCKRCHKVLLCPGLAQLHKTLCKL
jgi:hypothetical protein